MLWNEQTIDGILPFGLKKCFAMPGEGPVNSHDSREEEQGEGKE